ncbi:transcription factor IIIA isoform X2 [Phalaenopsis equestris]|nr:transcription factor IIIA isoform X2 [Phalaenopsis equestris]XP_020587077.1 transcription factor IIIA isoform X2 [Phalaenopsis equestris]XP_020587078.1 transcription factor IIIA isoform X2 [Phalaenopsis equestris]
METEAVNEDDKQRPLFRDIRRYYCEYCGICRSKKSLLRSHILSHHKDVFQTVKIDEISAFKAANQKVRHTCEECGASFWKPAHLVQHMRSHSVERPFACPVEDCYFIYRRKDHLNRHLLKHQGKVFNCPVEKCNRTFTFQGNMTRHVNEHHVDELPCEGKKQHVCEEPGCGKIFMFASKLKKHEDSHLKVESLEIYCGEPQCMKPFTNSECLKAHIQSCHRYVKCEKCGTQQLRKNFKRHQRLHEGVVSEERIKCSFQGCEQTYSKKSNLNKHVKAVHEKLRPFRCRTSGCQQTFPYKHVRDNHEKTHVYEQGDFLEADERWRSRPRGGRKRERVTIEALTRKRVVPVDCSSIMENGDEYLRWLLADDNE